MKTIMLYGGVGLSQKKDTVPEGMVVCGGILDDTTVYTQPENQEEAYNIIQGSLDTDDALNRLKQQGYSIKTTDA